MGQGVDSNPAGRAFVEVRPVVESVLVVEEQGLVHLGRHFLTLFHQTNLLDHGRQKEVGAMVGFVHVPRGEEVG